MDTLNTDRDWVIYDYGPQKTVTGKSFLVSTYNKHNDQISYYNGHVGTSWNKMYFGDGKVDSGGGQDGYDDMYLFFRTWMSKRMFPTYDENTNSTDIDILDDGTGKPVRQHIDAPGHRYTGLTSFKWINIGSGFLNARDWYDQKNDVVTEWPSYGSPENWLHLKPKNIGSEYVVAPQFASYHSGNGYNHIYPSVSLEDYLDTEKMIGVEMHLKMETVAGPDVEGGNTSDGVIEIWFYDENGNSQLVLSSNNMAYRRIGESIAKFNRLFIQSNNRTYEEPAGSAGYYRCGTGMECGWWMDDLIVDDQRIGPKYYSLLAGEPECTNGQTQTCST